MNCHFCDTPLHRDDAGTWVDDTDGDCCWGDDDLVNENESHVPGGVNHPCPRCLLVFDDEWERDQHLDLDPHACEHLSIDDPTTEAQMLTGIRPREWTVRCEDCGRTWTHKRGEEV